MAPEKAHLQVETYFEVSCDLAQAHLLALINDQLSARYSNTSQMLHLAILPVAAATESADSIAEQDLGLMDLP